MYCSMFMYVFCIYWDICIVYAYKLHCILLYYAILYYNIFTFSGYGVFLSDVYKDIYGL